MQNDKNNNYLDVIDMKYKKEKNVRELYFCLKFIVTYVCKLSIQSFIHLLFCLSQVMLRA